MKYEADAMINGLAFDRHDEAKAVGLHPCHCHGVPGVRGETPWEPAHSQLEPRERRHPDIFEMLKTAVEADNK